MTTPTIYRTNGTSEPFVFKARYPTLDEMQAVVEGYIKAVYISDADVMIVDDEGAIKVGRQLNAQASKLARQAIYGNVIVMPRRLLR